MKYLSKNKLICTTNDIENQYGKMWPSNLVNVETTT